MQLLFEGGFYLRRYGIFVFYLLAIIRVSNFFQVTHEMGQAAGHETDFDAELFHALKNARGNNASHANPTQTVQAFKLLSLGRKNCDLLGIVLENFICLENFVVLFFCFECFLFFSGNSFSLVLFLKGVLAIWTFFLKVKS